MIRVTKEAKEENMKKILILAGFILASILGIPLTIISIGGYYTPDRLGKISSSAEFQKQQTELEKQIISIVTKEVKPDEPIEALKAQTVIIRTYLLRRQLGIIQKGQLTGLTIKEMKELWQDDFEETYELYEQAVKATKDKVLYYEDEIIEPVYHRESGGKTRGSEAVYGVSLPYLKSVVSDGDGEATKVSMSKQEIVEKLVEAYPDIIIDTPILEHQIQIVNKDEGNYIQSMQIGNTLIEGEDLRRLLGLSSSNFEIGYTEDKLIFYVKGAGHGIGLSQKGANTMAKKGSTYEEILKYYFQGTHLVTYGY